MVHSINRRTNAQPPRTKLDKIRGKIANSMIGREVALLVGSDRTACGTVTAVQIEAGIPKILVAGSRYDLGQVLAVIPTTIN